MTTTPETITLTRAEAHRKLLALGMPAERASHVLDYPNELLNPMRPTLTVAASEEAAAIVAAYQRHCESKATTDPLATVPAEERTRIVEIATKERHATGMRTTAPWAGEHIYERAIAREVAAWHAAHPKCSRCGGADWLAIPDSLAMACKACGDVLVRTTTGGWEPGASLQEWAADMAANAAQRDAPETLTRAQAENRLRALSIRPKAIAAWLAAPQSAGDLALASEEKADAARAILRAYVRGLNAHEGIVERAIRLDREATAAACGPDLTPAEPESDDPLADLLLVLPPRDLVAARAEIAARREIIASAPGQTPIARAPSTIAAAFEAILAFFICLIGPRPHRKITPAEEIGALAACEVETDFTPDSPPTDLTRLRDLIQCAAEEYAQIRADASKRLDRVAASRRERKAADLAAGRVTEEELREIDARTSGPGPLAGDGALLRRCAAEIRRLTAKLAGIEGVAAQGDGMMAKISEQAAEIERLKRQVDNAENEAMHAQDECDLPEAPAAASLEARAPTINRRAWLALHTFETTDSWLAVVRAVDASRPTDAPLFAPWSREEARVRLLGLGHSALAVDAWLDQPAAMLERLPPDSIEAAVLRGVLRGDASRPGLTEERGDKIGPTVRVTTSGAPRGQELVCVAVAKLFRAMGGESIQDEAGDDLAAFLRLRDGEEESEEVASLRRQLASETTRANLAEAILRSSPGLSTACPCARCVRELPPCPTALVCVLCGAVWVNGQKAPEKKQS